MSWMIPAALAGVDLAANLFGANQAKHQAEAANKKNRQLSAIMNLISVAGGKGISSVPQVQAEPASFSPEMLTGALRTGMSTYSLLDQIKTKDYNQALEAAKLGDTTGGGYSGEKSDSLYNIAVQAQQDRELANAAKAMQPELIGSEILKNQATAGYYGDAGTSLKEQALLIKKQVADQTGQKITSDMDIDAQRLQLDKDRLGLESDRLASERDAKTKTELNSKANTALKAWTSTGDTKHLEEYNRIRALQGLTDEILPAANPASMLKKRVIGGFVSE